MTRLDFLHLWIPSSKHRYLMWHVPSTMAMFLKKKALWNVNSEFGMTKDLKIIHQDQELAESSNDQFRFLGFQIM